MFCAQKSDLNIWISSKQKIRNKFLERESSMQQFFLASNFHYSKKQFNRLSNIAKYFLPFGNLWKSRKFSIYLHFRFDDINFQQLEVLDMRFIKVNLEKKETRKQNKKHYKILKQFLSPQKITSLMF